MALIKQDEQIDKVILKAKIDKATMESAKNYCEWAGISDISHLVGEALEYVFKTDKDWQKHALKQNEKTKADA